MGEIRNSYHSQDVSEDGRIILKWAIKKQDVKAWTRFIWHSIVTSGGLL
jgi:hypothetical protein